MPSFSQRLGHKPLIKVVQSEEMDEDLTNSLWNVFLSILESRLESTYASKESPHLVLLWTHFFKKPLDELPRYSSDCSSYFKKLFYTALWYERYDLIEVVCLLSHSPSTNRKRVNQILEVENAAYRFVGEELAPITNQVEITSVEETLALPEPFKSVSLHIQAALKHFSDKKSPDYRNSAKEAICAVESLCQTLTGSKGPLGQLLSKLEAKKIMHPTLTQAMSKLYGFTSDAGGVRHALNGNQATKAEAMFLLISSSAFINYCLSLVAEGKISVSEASSH